MDRLSKYQNDEAVKNAMSLARVGTPLVVFDLETTGLGKKSDRILSFSAIKAVWKSLRFEEVDRMDVFINPEFHIPKEVTEINHITDEMVAGCKTEEEVIPEILSFIGDNSILCGYNSHSFDIPFLANAALRAAGEDLEMAAELDVMYLAKEKCNFSSYKLEDVASELGCNIGLTFHRSMDDVIATLRVLNVLLIEYDGKPRGGVNVEVTGFRRFSLSHLVNRIYVNTFPYSKTYYDIYRGEWHTDLTNVNLKQLRIDALKLAGASDEKEFAKNVG